MPAAADALKLRSTLLSKATLRHMLVLTKLAELGSMTRAAEATNMTQPAISVMVADLERLVGVPLFLRHARGVKPTRAALELLPVAKRIVAATADGAEAVSSILNAKDGLVRIAASVTANGKLMQPFLPGFEQRFPRIQVDLTDLGPRNPLDLVTQQDCHLACIGRPTTIPENCTFNTLCEDRLVVVGPVGHELSGNARASYQDLSPYRWITTSSGTVAREQFEVLADRIALSRGHRCGVSTNTPNVLLNFVSKHDFLALLPESVISPWVASGSVIAIESEASTPLPPLGLLWETDEIPQTAQTFIAALVEFSRSLSSST